MSSEPRQLLPRWYFGGIAASFAVCFTHPLDLIKVQLQTQGEKKIGLVPLTVGLVKREGFLALYNGLTASVFRQMLYSTFRFGMYDTVKIMLGSQSTFASKVGVAFAAGGIGGFMGTPPDKVNVRMQHDVKLPREKRYNYKHVLDGLMRIHKEEGFKQLFSGASMASLRAAVIGVGQIAFYDQIKIFFLTTPYFEDNLICHFTTSLVAGGIATAMTQPFDVLKTRIMNSKPGEFNSVMAAVLYTAKEGPLGFFRGFIPAFVRIAPQTILTFVFYEQLRMNFGYYKNETKKD